MANTSNKSGIFEYPKVLRGSRRVSVEPSVSIARCDYSCAIWIRLPHVSSKTAMVAVPILVGGVRNTTPSFLRR